MAAACLSHALIADIGLALLAAPAPALAWGHRAHTAIDADAIAGLPADGPTFLGDYAS